jgi:hypothetical protein
MNEACHRMATQRMSELTRDVSSNGCDKSSKATVKTDLGKNASYIVELMVIVGTRIMITIDLDRKWSSHPMLQTIKYNMLRLYDEQ